MIPAALIAFFILAVAAGVYADRHGQKRRREAEQDALTAYRARADAPTEVITLPRPAPHPRHELSARARAAQVTHPVGRHRAAGVPVGDVGRHRATV